MEWEETVVALGRDNGDEEAVRRDPDAILRRIREEEAAGDGEGATGPARGKLKVFFGYAAGVGKTYAMLRRLVPTSWWAM